MLSDKRRFAFAHALAWAPPLAVLAALIAGTAVFDAMHAGPYSRWCHERLMNKARSASIIGCSETSVRAALGDPSFVCTGHSGPRGENTIGLCYLPVPFVPCSPFQVWVRAGRVMSVESFDRPTVAF